LGRGLGGHRSHLTPGTFATDTHAGNVPSLMSRGMNVTFYGVRGSTPCDDPALARYGGNTSCVVIEIPGADPIILDLGTGLRTYGDSLVASGNAAGWRGSVLLTHLHWDHVQGFPFFKPLHQLGSEVDIYGPDHGEAPLSEMVGRFMGPPYFPITPAELGASVRFHDVSPGSFKIGDAVVTALAVRHTGPTLGFRVDCDDVSVVYMPDHGPGCSSLDDDFVPQDVIDLCNGADLLIHDAQHTLDEYPEKRHWGHSSVNYAVKVAISGRVRSLALFHHDPMHDDAEIDSIEQYAAEIARSDGAGLEVFAARDGLELKIEPTLLDLTPQVERADR